LKDETLGMVKHTQQFESPWTAFLFPEFQPEAGILFAYKGSLMDAGYMPIWRKIQNNPVWESNDMLAIWIRLLLKANHKDGVWWNGNRHIKVKPGQFISSGPKLAEYLKLPRTTVMRKLEILKLDNMIDIKTDKQFTTITICNYRKYQEHIKMFGQLSEQVGGQAVDRERTGSGQAVDTIKEVKELKEVKEIIEHLNGILGTKYQPTTKSTIISINARLKEGYTTEDFKTIHIKKHKEWNGTEHEKYLTPETLYRPANFEKYLNQTINEPKSEWE